LKRFKFRLTRSFFGSLQLDSVVNKIVNQVIKERPSDPLSAIAFHLLKKSRKSYPVFDKMTARRIFVADSPQCESLKINVFLTYQGRSALRYSHNFAFDPEEVNRFLFDDTASKSGLNTGVSMIGKEITETLRMNLGSDPLDIEALRKADAVLLLFYQ